MSVTVHRPDVTEYVAQVRTALDDLDGEVLEELVGGLDANLADLAAEAPEPLETRLGPPAAYAAELRAAAGLPPRGPLPPRSTAPPAVERQTATDVLRSLRGHSWWGVTRDFLLVIRPVWWLVRAYIAVQLLTSVRPAGLLELPLMALACVVSVELGRGRWGQGRGLASLVLAGNVMAVLAVPMLWPVGRLLSPWEATTSYVEPTVLPGLSRDGEPVRNVFPYDARGRPLSGVQLFDQDGRPLAVADPKGGELTTAADGSQTGSRPVPALDASSQPVWNVFPLSAVPFRVVAETGEEQPFGTPTPVRPQALSVPSVLPPASPPAPTPAPTTAAPTTALPSSP